MTLWKSHNTNGTCTEEQLLSREFFSIYFVLKLNKLLVDKIHELVLTVYILCNEVEVLNFWFCFSMKLIVQGMTVFI